MHKQRSLFITFEGIEGSGKSYQSKKLYRFIKKKNIPVILTREPGGTLGAEKIRDAISEVVVEGKIQTYDMAKMSGKADVVEKGAASTTQMADAIIEKL